MRSFVCMRETLSVFNKKILLYVINFDSGENLVYVICADPESFVRGGATSTTFSFYFFS